MEAVDRVIEARDGAVDRMDAGALPDALPGIGRVGTQQQRRRVDRAAGEHEMAGADPQRHSGRPQRLRVERLYGQLADLIALELQALGAGMVQQAHALAEGRRDRRDQHRLLGVDRAAEAAVAEVPAAADVARNHLPVHAELLAAGTQQVVVAVRRHRPGFDPEALFHALEPRRHLFGLDVAHTVDLTPVREGVVRRAQARGPVDDGGAAHGAALEDRDRAVGGRPRAGFLVQRGVAAELVHVLEVRGRVQRALLEHQHVEAGGSEDLGGGPAAGPTADDDHVRLEDFVLGQGRRVADVPAAADAVGIQVVDCHLRTPSGSVRTRRRPAGRDRSRPPRSPAGSRSRRRRA